MESCFPSCSNVLTPISPMAIVLGPEAPHVLCLGLEYSPNLLTWPKPVCPRAPCVTSPVLKSARPWPPILNDCHHTGGGHTEFLTGPSTPSGPGSKMPHPVLPHRLVSVRHGLACPGWSTCAGGGRTSGAEVPHSPLPWSSTIP